MLLNPIITKPLHRPQRAIFYGSSLALLVVASTMLSLRLLNHPVIPRIQPPVTDHGSLSVGSQAQAQALSAKDIIADVNAERAQQGLPSVTEDSRLDASAAEKSTQIAQIGWKSDPEANHINPDGTHGWIYAIEAAGCAQASEDLSYGNNTSQIVVEAWKHSAAHLASMNGPWSTVGVGISGSVVTMHLCRY